MKQLLRILFWALYFTIAFRICFRTPLNSIVFGIEAIVTGLLILYILLQILLALNGKILFSRYEIFLCFMLIFPFWSAAASYLEWGQPFFYGIATQRSFFLFITGFYLLYALKKGIVDLDVIKKSFLVVSWGSFIGFLVASQVINPANYIETDFVGYNELKGGYIFKFVVTFITLGSLYYFISFFKKGRFLYLLLGLTLFGYLVYVRQDRSIILTTVATIGLYFINHELHRKFFKGIFSFLVLTCVVTAILLSTGTDTIQVYFKKYDNIIKTLEGSQTTESSTNMRRIETIKVMPYIKKNPIIGSGELSLKWKNGFARIFGYMYPTDIGIVGELFLYGILGVLLLNSQFLLGWYYAAKAQNFNEDIFFLTCKFTLFTFFIDSLTAGQTVYYSANSIIIITILYFYSKRNSQQISPTIT